MEQINNYCIGIDPSAGGEKVHIAIFTAEGRFIDHLDRSLSELYATLQPYSPAVVAVNSPSACNNGRVRLPELRENLPDMHIPGRNVDMRVAEYVLRAKGIHVGMTPSILPLCTQAIHVGFEIYQILSSLGYSVEENAPLRMIETSAHAVYCVLAGVNPLPKLTLEGRLQRQLLLFDGGLQIKDPMEFLEEVTRHKLLKGILPWDELYKIETLDAMSSALTALYTLDKEKMFCTVGDKNEGQIFLPVAELLAAY